MFCDLWRFTTDSPTPEGAIPHQLRAVLDEAGPVATDAQLKLYNASNFFDPRAVPTVDDEAVARLAMPFERVIVEAHPKLVGERALRFAGLLDGQLEVAMGLETVHPEAQPRLGKGATLDDVRRAAELLGEHGIGWRAFLLVGAPRVPAEDDARWVARGARFATEHGACHVSLIPVRGGNGTLEAMRQSGEWTPPTLASLEDAFDACLAFRSSAVITVDLWDIERLEGGCPACRPARRGRLEAINHTGRPTRHETCPDCGARATFAQPGR